MKRKREKANDIVRTFHYNTRSSSRNKGTSDTGRVDAIVKTTSASLKVTKRRKRKRISDDRRRDLDLLPMELIMEILKRLPVKTLARFLCVSKLWASTFRSPYFMKLFLTESSNRSGRLFFSFKRYRDCFFFSSLQTQVPGEASVATCHRMNPAYNETTNSSFVHGLICYKTASDSKLKVYNSSTRRSITLPKFKRGNYVKNHFLGYDPINGVYKVLCMTRPELKSEPLPDPVFQVLTLGNESSWKMIENTTLTHFPSDTQICISGVIYYEAYAGKEVVVMSFDVRSERFDLIKRPGDAHPLVNSSTMIRYEGKLAITSREISANGSIVLWVLEDAVRHEWFKKVLVLPNCWKNLAQGSKLLAHESHRFVNVSDAGELIMAPRYLRVPRPPYYVLCYDPKRNSVRKAQIKGITEQSHPLLRWKRPQLCRLFHLFSSQVESLMFL